MSQMTLDGFMDESKPALPETPAKVETSRAETWYKGRVLSHSSISMYRTCPQRWKFRYIDKVPEKPRSQFSFGKSVHSALEFLFAKVGQPWPTVEELIANYQLKWLREGYESPVQEKWFFQEGERILKGYYAKHSKDKNQAFVIEHKFTVDIEGVPVLGYIDRVDKTPRGTLALLDYKTGKAFDKSRVRVDPQLTLYQMASEQTLGAPVESVTLYHLNSLTPLTVPAHSKKQENDYRGVVVEAAKDIMDLNFDPTPDERAHCMWCDYMQICPAFAGKKNLQLKSAGPALTDLADKYGKLTERVRGMQAEADQVGLDIEARMRVSGQTAAQGQHFTVKMEAAEGKAPALTVGPTLAKPKPQQ